VRRNLIIVGGGEHAQAVVEAANSRPQLWKIEGLVDVNPAAKLRSFPTVRNLGQDQFLKEKAAREQRWAILGIGSVSNSSLRRRIVESYGNSRICWAVIIHAGAWVSSSAALAPGTVILAGAVVNSGAMLGAHSIVNSGAIIEHNVEIGEFSVISPACAIGGGTTVGADSFVGIGAKIRDHLKIGRQATVGMGAVVVRDVAAGATVMGVPAREPQRQKS